MIGASLFFRPDSLRPKLSTPYPAAIFLPKEHGSWSLALEPLLLGLLVVPSRAGLTFAVVALAGFFLRRPLKTVLARDDSVHRRSNHKSVGLFSALVLVGLGETVALGGLSRLWPLLPAAIAGGWFVYFDAQNEARTAAVELAGSVAFALLPATFATLAGWSGPAAFALSAVALARSVPTVLTVRTCLRLNKRQQVVTLAPLVAGCVALGVMGLLAAWQLVPVVAVGWAVLLLVRSMIFVTALRPAWSARRVGIMEAVLGVCYLGSIAFAYHL